MDNVRLILILALVFISVLLWEAWQADYVTPQTGQPVVDTAIQNDAITDESAPDAPLQADIDAPALLSTDTTSNQGQLIQVVTDTLDLQIDTHGGTVVDAKLMQYPVSVDTPSIKYHLLSQRPSDYFIVQSGLLGADQVRTPTHRAIFQAEQSRYVMAAGADTLVVDLVWQSPDGLQVIKRYTFQRGKHSVQLEHWVNNQSNQAWTGREYRQIQRGRPADGGSFFMPTYTGGVIYSPEDKYEKYTFDNLASGDLNRDVTDGWVAMIQHYFLSALVPPTGQPQHFYGKQLANGHAIIGAYTPTQAVAPGEQKNFTGVVFIGPKLRTELEQVATDLDLTVDYGWLAMIAKPMHWFLEQINAYVGNWGWTIIIFTLLIKLIFFKLSETSYRSMANMRKLMPRIQALKDRYGDDKQRLQKAMMELYKKDKINPLGGCLPMLVQMPFFIALYWVLLESVEMRQAPWILWIDDLSIKDPYFILPVLMGASMFVQQKLNPAPLDPMQAKIMLYLPVVFSVMFAFFPSGLVLYWVVNNLLSIAQQWVITRRIEQAASSSPG